MPHMGLVHGDMNKAFFFTFPQDFRDAEHHMLVRDRFDHLPAQSVNELHHPLPVARREEVTPFARKR